MKHTNAYHSKLNWAYKHSASQYTLTKPWKIKITSEPIIARLKKNGVATRNAKGKP